MPTSLHLTNAYHASSGGIRTFYEALLRDAEPHGRHVCLVVPGERDRVEDVSPFARIYTIAAPSSPFVDRRYRLVLPHRFLMPERGRIWRILRDEQPDLIEICDKYAFCYLAGVLRIRIGVCLLGVAIGEGAICAIYIFLGHAVLTS